MSTGSEERGQAAPPDGDAGRAQAATYADVRSAGVPARLFHGGYPLLRPGQLVEPPARTASAVVPVTGKRPDRVYVTEDIELAAYFARLSTVGSSARWRSAAVYEVEPVGDLEFDPHSTDDAVNLWRVQRLLDPSSAGEVQRRAGFEVPAARVLRVVRTDVRMSAAEAAAHRAIAAEHGKTWEYERPQVDDRP